jgi:hypothetical protein
MPSPWVSGIISFLLIFSKCGYDRLNLYAYGKKNILGELWSKMEMNLSEENYLRILQAGLPFSRLIPFQVPDQIFRVIVYDPGVDKAGSKLVKLR